MQLRHTPFKIFGLIGYEMYTACKRCTKLWAKFDLTELVLCDLNKMWSCDFPDAYLICGTILSMRKHLGAVETVPTHRDTWLCNPSLVLFKYDFTAAVPQKNASNNNKVSVSLLKQACLSSNMPLFFIHAESCRRPSETRANWSTSQENGFTRPSQTDTETRYLAPTSLEPPWHAGNLWL